MNRRVGLFTDLYELTMADAYDAEHLDAVATFELFVRSLPPERRFLVACGVRTAVEGLTAWGYDGDELAYLGGLGIFSPRFLDRLSTLSFTGDVDAVAEGEVVFAGEPILSVTAPVVEAQLVETYLLNVVGFQTMVASKAARLAIACGDATFVDFSARRDHGLDAAGAAARASYVGGAAATSLVSAGRDHGLALSGTMAHSYVLAHEREEDALRAFLRRYREQAVLLIDTYDTVGAAHLVVRVAREERVAPRAVRLDSGDLGALSVAVRAVLDEGGLGGVGIFASGDLDEYAIEALRRRGAPVDGFGVGTRLGTSADIPYLGVVYKLVALGGRGVAKRSPGKVTEPGRKQVWRTASHDVVDLAGEPGPAGGRPLLGPVARGGRLVRPLPAEPEALAAARQRRAAQVEALPAPARLLAPTSRPVWPVQRGPALEALAARAVGPARSGPLAGAG